MSLVAFLVQHFSHFESSQLFNSNIEYPVYLLL